MHKAMRLAGQPWVNISFREAHSNSMSLQSPESQGERHFYLWKQNGFLLSPLTLSSLISLFLLCLNPKFGPSIILTCPEFSSFQSQRATNSWSKEPSPTAACHQLSPPRVTGCSEQTMSAGRATHSKSPNQNALKGFQRTYSYPCRFRWC